VLKTLVGALVAGAYPGAMPYPSELDQRDDDPFWRRHELPTWGVAAAIYGGYVLLTWQHEALPWWLVSALGAWLLCWHASLQHEAIHGHPTASSRLNAFIAGVPLGLWLPYPIYRRWHIAHHRAAILTAPACDPESFYVSAAAWRRAGRVRRRLLVWRNTLAGRLLLGPPWLVGAFLRDELILLLSGERRHLAAWLWHLSSALAVLGWLWLVELPLWFYLVGMLWPALSLTLLRSFHEHRPASMRAAASLTLHASTPLALLFLNNNLHAAHHARPRLAWYELPRYQRRHRPESDYVLRGYHTLFRRYLLRPRDAPVHPG